MNIEKEIKRYKKEYIANIVELIDGKVQPLINSFCEKWKLCFIVGNGEWFFYAESDVSPIYNLEFSPITFGDNVSLQQMAAIDDEAKAIYEIMSINVIDNDDIGSFLYDVN